MNQILLTRDDIIGPDAARLTGRRLDHLNEVLKSAHGETLRAGFLGGNRGSAVVRSISSSEAVLELSLHEAPPQPLDLILVAAVQRPKTTKRILQYAASAGIKSIWLVRTWRVDKSYFDSPVMTEEGIYENLILGLEQGRDTILPDVQIRHRFKPFVEDELSPLVPGATALAAHPAAQTDCPRGVTGKSILAVGPEGGFLPYEIELFASNGFTPVTIGERPLRSEYALPALVGRIS
jgi:RsmE family RNA methyltransferase